MEGDGEGAAGVLGGERRIGAALPPAAGDDVVGGDGRRWLPLRSDDVADADVEHLGRTDATTPPDEVRELAHDAAGGLALDAAARAVEGESHAWVEWWAGEWVGFDPTSLAPAGARLVARGRDCTDVTPLKGSSAGPTGSTLFVSVQVTRPAQGRGRRQPITPAPRLHR
jgi:hypothetical protein